jgi:alpha-1,3-rhamnosyl/mannosyltransferase
MRVLLNNLAATGARTGIGHYTAQLMRCLRTQAADAVIDTWPGPCVATARQIWGRFRFGQRAAPAAPAPGSARRAGWKAWLVGRAGPFLRARLIGNFRRRAHSGAFDLYHEPNIIPLSCDLPTVATVHDLSAVLHPEWHPADRVAEYDRWFRQGLAQCDHVLAISEFARQEIIRTLGVPPERVTRTYMGVRPGLGPMPEAEVQAILRALGLPPRYLLYLGTIEPRKNVMTLLRAYVRLPAAVRERCPLLLAGGWGWSSADVAAFLDGEARHRGVIFTGYLREADLPAVMNGARALVYPSLYEGFGMPPAEMMACGGAVICSTAGALVETVGARAHLVEPLDEDGWRAALGRAAVDDDWVAELRRGAVEAARPFTWERCAADTLAAYRAVCGRHSRGLRTAG